VVSCAAEVAAVECEASHLRGLRCPLSSSFSQPILLCCSLLLPVFVVVWQLLCDHHPLSPYINRAVKTSRIMLAKILPSPVSCRGVYWWARGIRVRGASTCSRDAITERSTVYTQLGPQLEDLLVC
jgi:hypothetical protein